MIITSLISVCEIRRKIQDMFILALQEKEATSGNSERPRVKKIYQLL